MDSATPRQLGYGMPAEWAPHDATWISWPRRDGISFPGAFDRVMPTFRAMVAALVASERVCINVCDAAHEAEARQVLGRLDKAQISFYHVPTNEPWCRDHGPIFVTRNRLPSLAAIDWDYNAWGGKYPPFDLDEVVPTRIAEILQIPVFHPGMILEGGSIEVNGDGALLTTESCLLNENRNGHMTRNEVEARLREYLGVNDIVWLARGTEGDDTDGHIDNLARFVAPRTVLAAVEENQHSRNYQPLQENLARLRATKIAGESLDIFELPMPSEIERDGLVLPASYANFYIANRCVLAPIFLDPNDGRALAILRALFTDRRIIPIDCRELIWGLGAFHCLTQQQPAV